MNIGYWFEVGFINSVVVFFKKKIFFLGFWLHCTPKQDWVFIFDTVRESSVWSVLGFVFDKKCVRVTSEMEVGYRVVTKWSTCG